MYVYQLNHLQFVPAGLLLGYAVLRLARYLKKSGPMDYAIYLGLPAMGVVYMCQKLSCSHLFSIGYPAHPYILEQRRRVINKACFFAPFMMKNEIEFMHKKLSGGLRTEEDLAEKLREEEGTEKDANMEVKDLSADVKRKAEIEKIKKKMNRGNDKEEKEKEERSELKTSILER